VGVPPCAAGAGRGDGAGGGGGGPTFEYYALDALGSVRVVFDAAGAVKARADYEPFGSPIPSSTTGPLPREQFTGQQRDSEVGLDYFGARFYHATHGRMLSVDPLSVGAMADPQRWNRYAYALNSPQTMVDPDGRVAQCKSILINYWYEYDGMHLIHQSYQDTCTGGTYPGRGGQGGQSQTPKPPPITITEQVVVIGTDKEKEKTKEAIDEALERLEDPRCSGELDGIKTASEAILNAVWHWIALGPPVLTSDGHPSVTAAAIAGRNPDRVFINRQGPFMSPFMFVQGRSGVQRLDFGTGLSPDNSSARVIV
jgi:RHS repeat-associated protein